MRVPTPRQHCMQAEEGVSIERATTWVANGKLGLFR